MKLQPKRPEWLVARGASYLGKDDYGSAERDADEAIRQSPACARAYVVRADARRHQAMLALAVQDYSRAIALGDTWEESFVGRGAAYLAMNDLAKARADCQEAIRRAPKDGAPHYILADVCGKEGDARSRLRELELAIELTPTNADYYVARADAYLRRATAGRHQGSLQCPETGAQRHRVSGAGRLVQRNGQPGRVDRRPYGRLKLDPKCLEAYRRVDGFPTERGWAAANRC